MGDEPPVSGARGQPLTTPDIFPEIGVKLIICLAPRQSLLGGYADCVVLAHEIENLVHGLLQRQVVRVHEEENQVLELQDALFLTISS